MTITLGSIAVVLRPHLSPIGLPPHRKMLNTISGTHANGVSKKLVKIPHPVPLAVVSDPKGIVLLTRAQDDVCVIDKKISTTSHPANMTKLVQQLTLFDKVERAHFASMKKVQRMKKSFLIFLMINVLIP